MIKYHSTVSKVIDIKMRLEVIFVSEVEMAPSVPDIVQVYNAPIFICTKDHTGQLHLITKKDKIMISDKEGHIHSVLISKLLPQSILKQCAETRKEAVHKIDTIHDMREDVPMQIQMEVTTVPFWFDRLTVQTVKNILNDVEINGGTSIEKYAAEESMKSAKTPDPYDEFEKLAKTVVDGFRTQLCRSQLSEDEYQKLVTTVKQIAQIFS